MNQGFALILALLLLLFLTLFGFTLLLIAGNYYSSSKNLFENENARLASEQAGRMMVDRHNFGSSNPKFFFDPAIWINQKMIPLQWNGFEINAELEAPWSSTAADRVNVSVRRGRFESVMQYEIRQIRPEDFALFAESGISLNQTSLFDGLVMLRNGLYAAVPAVRFRDLVQGEISPETNASFRIRSEQYLNYPYINEFLSRDRFYEEAVRSGFVIAGADPLFWNMDTSRYELDLRRLEIVKENPAGWRVSYNGAELGVSAALHFWFDHDLVLRQGYDLLSEIDGKIHEPIYISSAGNIILQTSVQPLESAAFRHPLCIVASGAIYLKPSSLVTRLNAFLISFGGDDVSGGFIVEAGGAIVSEEEKALLRTEINSSVFLVENEKHQEFLNALDVNEKVLWLRGSLFTQKSITTSNDLTQLHFEAASGQYLFLPSFPFVQIVEGSTLWR